MFCPSCGSEERQPNQFCRACGTDLRRVRTAVERPDKITASAVSAREEVGHAIAAKIREIKTVEELGELAEDVLPEIEKFLESPAEKRLRRIRAGVVTASIGVGTTLFFFLLASLEKDVRFLPAAGLIVFFIGLGIVLNGLLFTVPPQDVADNSLEASRQRELEGKFGVSANQIADYAPPANSPLISSVTEHTTHQLTEKKSQN